MKQLNLVSEGNGSWGVACNGVRVITGESYQVASNIVEGNGTGETEEIRRAILENQQEEDGEGYDRFYRVQQ